MRRALGLAIIPLLATVAVACGDDSSSSEGSNGSASPLSGEITVFAAASLTESFTEIGEAFTAAYPDAAVVFNFASSSSLVTQINEGAPADVYASADLDNMDQLVDAGNNGAEPVVFARNSLAIAVEAGNPQGIDGLDDLENPDLIIVTCDPEVPIGAYSAEVFDNAGVTVAADSYEEDVKAVFNKVVLGEADAGVVYSTDVVAAGDDVTGVEIPAEVNVTPEYPLAVTAEAPNADGAAAFTEFVVSAAGQQILASRGFSAP